MISDTLRPAFTNGDNVAIPSKSGKTKDAITIYNDFVSSLLKNTKNHCISFNERTIILFNEHSYIKDITSSNERSDICDISFVAALIKTQCFSNYIASSQF